MTPSWREAEFLIDDGEGGRIPVTGWAWWAFGLCRSPYDFWCPVHLPTGTGICPGTEFPTLDLAKAFCEALTPLVDDWTMLTLEQAEAASDAICFGIACAAQTCRAVNPLYAEPERKAS